MIKDDHKGNARQWFHQALLHAGGQDWHVVTPNQRLALFLGRDWAHQESQTQPVWQPLQVQPWQQWLGSLWQSMSLQQGLKGAVSLKVLAPDEIKACWDKIAGAQHADQALEADRLAREWGLALEPLHCNDHQLLAVQWQKQYAVVKHHKGWCDSTDILQRLVEDPMAFASFLPKPLLFYGFVEYSPLQKQCLQALESVGVVCHRELILKHAGSTQSPRIYEAQDSLDDLYAAAQWARSRWQALANEQDFNENDLFDGPRIAVIVPDLAQQQAKVKSVFSEVLQWQEMLEKPVHWTISAGMAFSDYSLIQTLLDLLDLSYAKLDLAGIERVLRSEFWVQGASAKLAPLVFESMRNTGRESWSLVDLRFWLAGFFMEMQRKTQDDMSQVSLTHARDLLLAAVDQLQAIHQADSYAQLSWNHWLDRFLNTLIAVEWPGARLLQSDDFQVLQRWHTWWIAQQQQGPELIRYGEARARLGRAWRELMFQPEASTDRILVLGLLEATALPLDEVYILGLTAANWPAASQPNPFLPFEEQRAHGLPRASTQREVWYGQALLHWYHRSTKALHIGYARTHEDVPQFLSPLVTNLFGLLAPQQVQALPWRNRLEITYAAPADKLPPLEGTVRLRSATRGLAEQGICPFRGALALRIQPGQVVMPKTSVTGLDRGQWLHKVFEIIWQHARDSNGLQRLLLTSDKDQLSLWVGELLTKVGHYLPLLTPMTQTVEHQRLLSLVQQALAYEQTRPVFEVRGLEEKVILQWQDLVLELRLDRWDTQADRLILIDYKTNPPQTSSERMIAPQLILYVLALAQKLRLEPNQMGQQLQEAVYFVVNPKKGAQWLDVIAAQEASDAVDAPTQWLTQELQLLNEVCGQVRAGVAELNPIEGDKTCQACDYQSFCRVRERQHGVLNEED